MPPNPHHRQKPSRGSVALAKALAKPKTTADLARELDCTPQLVSRWASGWRVPQTAERMKLEKKFAIALLDWDEPVEEEMPPASERTGAEDTDSEPTTGTHG